MIKVLLTGSTGYIGRRLKAKLMEDADVQLRIFVRSIKKARESAEKSLEIIKGDTFNKESLKKAAAGIDVAYYLIHSMGSGKNFEQLDRISAENFRNACIEAGVKRIIYLGGLGVKETASKHLLSRIETGEILSAMPLRIQTIWFRAGIIIGSGSASFEIIRNLVQKLPVMVTPKWVSTKTQPIGIGDVLNYLWKAKDRAISGNLMVDIGAEQMSFKEMLERTAEVMPETSSSKRHVIPVPVLTPRLSSYWLVLFTPVPYKVASALIEGLKSETVIQNDNAEKYFPDITPAPFEEVVRRALLTIESNEVISRWCDSSAGEVSDVSHNPHEMTRAIYKDQRIYSFGETAPHKIFTSVKLVGGKNGWFNFDFLWVIRGFIDKLFGGYGINRGRRNDIDLRIGDKLDFWKVVDIKNNNRLLLEAQMKVPGRAWLEFRIEGDNLVQTAYFYPNNLLGKIYWYLTMPFHFFVFRDLARNIIKRAEKIA